MNEVIELIYGAKIIPDGNGFLVTFRDVDNAVTGGKNYQEAIFNAQEVLDLMLLDSLEKDEQIFLPSEIKKGEIPVSASPDVAAPVLLHILRKMEHLSMAEVARTMEVPYQSYQRIEAGKNLTMKSLKKAAAALGAIVEIKLRKAKAAYSKNKEHYMVIKKITTILSVISILFFSQIFADSPVNLSDLVKVTKENNPNCVEYFTYKNEMYCSTRPLTSDKLNPNVKSFEKIAITFDDRAWQLAWGEATPSVYTVEYVPSGENIDNWNELITSQFFPDLQQRATPQLLANGIMEQIKKSDFKSKITVIENTPDRVIFEFQVTDPKNLQQDELQAVFGNDKGLYILHYVIKKEDMGKESRDKWVELMKKAGPKS